MNQQMDQKRQVSLHIFKELSSHCGVKQIYIYIYMSASVSPRRKSPFAGGSFEGDLTGAPAAAMCTAGCSKGYFKPLSAKMTPLRGYLARNRALSHTAKERHGNVRLAQSRATSCIHFRNMAEAKAAENLPPFFTE